jgi:hypothetical protein
MRMRQPHGINPPSCAFDYPQPRPSKVVVGKITEARVGYEIRTVKYSNRLRQSSHPQRPFSVSPLTPAALSETQRTKPGNHAQSSASMSSYLATVRVFEH